jgi:hypothetical protein
MKSMLFSTPRRSFLRQLGLASLGLGVGGLDACTRSVEIVTDPDSPYTILTNPTDPLLFQYKTELDEVINYFGPRDAQGLPLRVELISYQKSEQSPRADYFLFDSQERPTRMILDDGSQFILDWQSQNKAALTFIAPNNQGQINTGVDFTEALRSGRTAVPAPGTAVYGGQGLAPRQGAQIKLAPLPEPEADERPGGTGQRTSQEVITINVSACGIPTDAPVVSVNMYKTDGLNQLVKVGEFPAQRSARGLYTVALPSDVASTVDVNFNEACKKANDVLGGLCKFIKYTDELCKVIGLTALAINAVTGNVPGALVAVVATRRCVALAKAAQTITKPGCQVMKEIDRFEAVSGDPYALCNALFENRDTNLWAGDLKFIAKAEGVGDEPVYAPSVTVDGKARYPDLTLDLGSKPSIKSLTLNPPTPIAKQEYVAVARITCLPLNSTVTLSIVGTDGYQDSDSITVFSLQPDGTFAFQLRVPGALTSGIKDIVTLVVRIPTGQTLNLTASLVFV